MRCRGRVPAVAAPAFITPVEIQNVRRIRSFSRDNNTIVFPSSRVDPCTADVLERGRNLTCSTNRNRTLTINIAFYHIIWYCSKCYGKITIAEARTTPAHNRKPPIRYRRFDLFADHHLAPTNIKIIRWPPDNFHAPTAQHVTKEMGSSHCYDGSVWYNWFIVSARRIIF